MHPHLYVWEHIHKNSDTTGIQSFFLLLILEKKGMWVSKNCFWRLQDLRSIWALGTISSLSRWKVCTATITYRTDEVRGRQCVNTFSHTLSQTCPHAHKNLLRQAESLQESLSDIRWMQRHTHLTSEYYFMQWCWHLWWCLNNGSIKWAESNSNITIDIDLIVLTQTTKGKT